MKLATYTPELVTEERVIEEVSLGTAILHLAPQAFISGTPLVEEIVHAARGYQCPETNRMLHVFLLLYRYAYNDRPTLIESLDLHHAFAFLLAIRPLSEFFGVTTPKTCEAIIQAAFARDKLHQLNEGFEPVINTTSRVADYSKLLTGGEAEGLTIFELALLSRMNEQSVRNALHKEKSIPRARGASKQVEVPLAAATKWLKRREGFIRYEPPRSDQILVPVAKDNTFFNATCKRGKGFTVGKKGEETYYPTFNEALIALQSMEPTYWRRPSATTGVHGIVRGVGWIAKKPAELGISV